MQPSLRRHELEDYVESFLTEIAEVLVQSDEDLQAAKDYHPSYFGGEFPTLGISVARTRDTSRYADQPSRPGRLIVEVKIYQPCLPVRGAEHRHDDRTGPAKRTTRRIRGLFLEAVIASSIGQHVEVVESRGGSIDGVGNAVTDERGRDILWIDYSELHVST